MSELWTARRKEFDDQGEEFIVFEVKDEETGELRDEWRFTSALPLMFALGGYPASIGVLMQHEDLPWRFRRVSGAIYLDDLEVRDCHPIEWTQ